MHDQRYNSRQYMSFGKRSWVLILAFVLANCRIASAAIDLSAPAADLAKRIAAISGPGPAKVMVKNSSSLTTAQVTEIRKLLERDLRGLGVINQSDSGRVDSSAISIRITLSSNASGGLWVAEVQEGTELHVAMVPVQLERNDTPHSDAGITLSKTLLWRQKDQVLDLLIAGSAASRRVIVLEPERIISYGALAPADAMSWKKDSWKPEQEFPIAHAQPFPRDMRGHLSPGSAPAGSGFGAGHLFMAYLPGVRCSGDVREGDPQLAIACEDGDDPWPMPGFTMAAMGVEPGAAPATQGVERQAFYNSGRNYFTGVLSPGSNLRLPPFYSAVPAAGSPGLAMILSGINGKYYLFEDGRLKRLTGTRDWGSDLAAIGSGCGTGTQIMVSASGWGSSDSLRAYEIAGQDATAVSPSLDMEGSITAIWPMAEASGATVIVRRLEPTIAGSGAPQQEDYEVYRVSAHCN